MPVISIGDGGMERGSAKVITSTWLTLGGRGVDTAYDYGNQADVASAIKASGIDRKNLFITTKIPGCSSAESYIEKDLKELGTDYIDLLLIHYPRGNDCAGAWSTLEDYHAKGVLKAIGVSHFTRSDITKLMKTAKVTPMVNQVSLNVLERDSDQIAASEENKITVEAYSPLGRGGLSGDVPGNKAIQLIASAHSVSTYQVAMKWILQHGWTLTFQSSKETHQKADADVFAFTLTDQEMSTLDKLQSSGSAVVV